MECPPGGPPHLESRSGQWLLPLLVMRAGPRRPSAPPAGGGGAGCESPQPSLAPPHVAVRRTAPAPQLHSPAPTGAALLPPAVPLYIRVAQGVA